jgi:hypothetical protein
MAGSFQVILVDDDAGRAIVLRRIDVAPKLRSRSELINTDTLESDIAALARTGERSQPVQG